MGTYLYYTYAILWYFGVLFWVWILLLRFFGVYEDFLGVEDTKEPDKPCEPPEGGYMFNWEALPTEEEMRFELLVDAYSRMQKRDQR